MKVQFFIRKLVGMMFSGAAQFLNRYTLSLLGLMGITGLSAQDQLRNIPNSDPEFERSTLYPAEGFEVNLFASEPFVVKPIQMNWDEKGRLWVVGSSDYPQPRPGAEPSGKVFILEDTDQDGRADTSIIFAEGLRIPTAVLPGDGGVYVANSTEILHLKDTDGDGKADERKVVLSGFGTGDTHHLIHTFRWGPDGSLYFNQSIYIYSHIETPYGVRRLEGGGVWRYRPTTRELEIYARGLVNPWGLQFNEYGQSFLTDGAGSEGIHYGFQGATYFTAPGAERIIPGLNPGQPKHSGLDFVTGRHIPEAWNGSLVTNDFRANRINRFSLERWGSGYISNQEADLLYSDNVAFRPVDILEGPDGAIYVADWYNPIIQHGEVDFRDPRRDRENGRIWRITRKDSPLVQVPDLVNASNLELLEYLRLPEAWTRDQARRLLKERGSASVAEDLGTWISNLNPEEPGYENLLLEGFRIYQALDLANAVVLKKLLQATKPLVRAAAVRVLFFQYDLYPDAYELVSRAVDDEDPTVRLEAVIALRQYSEPKAAAIAVKALDQEMDPYLDFALWQTIRELEPVWLGEYKKDNQYFGEDKKTAFALKSITHPDAVEDLVSMYRNDRLPKEYEKDFFESLTRYGNASALSALFDQLFAPNANQEAILGALIQTMEQRAVKPDSDLSRIATLFDSDDSNVAKLAVTVSSLWNLEQYRKQFVEWARNGSDDKREIGIEALGNLGDKESVAALREFTGKQYPEELRLSAISRLVSIDAKLAAGHAVSLLTDLDGEDGISKLLSTFFGNQNGLRELAQVLSGNTVPDQVSSVGMKLINSMSSRRQESKDIKTLVSVFGNAEVVQKKATMPQQLSAWDMDRLELDIKAYSDPVHGELVYRKLGCATCHAIGGAGGKLGTDLSSLGANAPTDYIISSVLNPGNEIKDGYELNQIIKKNGNVVMGYLVRETDSEVVLRDVVGNEVSVPKYQINTHQNIPGSLMPPGLTSGLTREEFQDLIGFLSKIGEPGDFRVPGNKFVRYWEILNADDAVMTRINEKGEDVIAKDSDSFRWTPAYSMVSGSLPLAEVEETGKNLKALKFSIEVQTPGMIELKFDPSIVQEIWVDGKSVERSSGGLQINLEAGKREIITLLEADPEVSEYSVEILDVQGSDGRAVPIQSAQ